VLMIDADHPNTEAGLQLFQTWSNGADVVQWEINKLTKWN